MITLLMQFVVAIAISFSNTTTIVDEYEYELSFHYVEINDITNANNEFENMRSTIEICYAINDTQKQIDDCANYAFVRATTTHI